jgi:hypothetical protein
MLDSSNYRSIYHIIKILISIFFCIILGLGFTWLVKDILTQTLFFGKGFEGRNAINQSILLALYAIVFAIAFWLISQSENNLYEVMKKKKRLGNIIFGVFMVIAIYLIIIHITKNLSTNIIYDETLYLAHMRLVMEGKIPYHDFYDWVPPVWLYIYAGIFKLFGENIVTARFLSTVFGFFTILLAVRLSYQLFGRWGGLLTLGLIVCVSPITEELVRYYYTASAVFYLFLALTIEEAFPDSYLKVICVEFFLILTVGTMQAFGLILLLYPFYQYFVQKNQKFCLIAIISSLFWGLLLALPFFITDFEATIWAMFSYNREIMPIRRDYSLESYSNYFRDVISHYFLIWIPIIFYSILKVLKKIIGAEINIIPAKNLNIIYLLSFFFWGVAIPVLLFNPTLTMQQHVYYLVIGCILATPLLLKVLEVFTPEWKVLFVCALIVILGLEFSNSRNDQYWNIHQNSILTNPDSLKSVISTAKDYLKDKPNGKIFSFVPYIGLEAGAKLFPGTEYGITSFALTWDEEKADRYNFFTQSQVLNWVVTRQPDLIITVDKSENTMYCCGPLGGLTFMKRFNEEVDKNYYLDKSWYINNYWGIVKFYLPRN